MLVGLQSSQLSSLQSVINAVARLVFSSARKSKHITLLLHDTGYERLSWLSSILFSLTFHCLHMSCVLLLLTHGCDCVLCRHQHLLFYWRIMPPSAIALLTAPHRRVDKLSYYPKTLWTTEHVWDNLWHSYWHLWLYCNVFSTLNLTNGMMNYTWNSFIEAFI